MSQTIAAKPKSEPAKKQGAPAPEEPPKISGLRDIVEQISVAFILALLMRGFEAEAFVIPTGSMAPTLMGRHKEITCPQCSFVYAVNAHDEEDVPFPGSKPYRVDAGICPNCRFQAKKLAATPSFNGDRILVLKFPYEFPDLPGSSGPRRWDVVVFRYPEKPEQVYIKRLIGMPGEDLRVQRGDLLARAAGSQEFARPPRPLIHQDAMQIAVWDDRYRPKDLPGESWQRWRVEGGKEEKPGTFTLGSGKLRYQHLVPDPEQWEAVANARPLPRAPRASLITDFYAFNTNLSARNSDLTGYPQDGSQRIAWMHPHWVGDLTLSLNLQVLETKGKVTFELIEAGVANRVTVDLATGEAILTHGETTLGTAKTTLNSKGWHAIEFANVDNRLTFRAGGSLPFGEGLSYTEGPTEGNTPTVADLDPVGLLAEGTSVAVSDLVLKRDIYYTQDPQSSDYAGVQAEFNPRSPVELIDALADPKRFPALGSVGYTDYPIKSDSFMMMGDNSPRSSDSRAWRSLDSKWDHTGRQSWEVPRALLVGKAFFVYWPHGVPFWPSIPVKGPDVRVPFRPYVERMKWIR